MISQLYFDCTTQKRKQGETQQDNPDTWAIHTQVAFITAIVKRFEGSGLSDVFVSASIIADK